jgi:hypothetical protein
LRPLLRGGTGGALLLASDAFLLRRLRLGSLLLPHRPLLCCL